MNFSYSVRNFFWKNPFELVEKKSSPVSGKFIKKIKVFQIKKDFYYQDLVYFLKRNGVGSNTVDTLIPKFIKNWDSKINLPYRKNISSDRQILCLGSFANDNLRLMLVKKIKI